MEDLCGDIVVMEVVAGDMAFTEDVLLAAGTAIDRIIQDVDVLLAADVIVAVTTPAHHAILGVAKKNFSI